MRSLSNRATRGAIISLVSGAALAALSARAQENLPTINVEAERLGGALTAKAYITSVSVTNTANSASALYEPGAGRAIYGGLRMKY